MDLLMSELPFTDTSCGQHTPSLTWETCVRMSFYGAHVEEEGEEEEEEGRRHTPTGKEHVLALTQTKEKKKGERERINKGGRVSIHANCSANTVLIAGAAYSFVGGDPSRACGDTVMCRHVHAVKERNKNTMKRILLFVCVFKFCINRNDIY